MIVSTPQDLSLIDARRGIAMFQQVNVPLLGVVENMSYFICPHCGGRTDIFAHGGARHEAETHGAPFLGEIPLDIVIRETSDGGDPVVVGAPDSPQAAAYVALADRVRDGAVRGPRATRPAPRIVIECNSSSRRRRCRRGRRPRDALAERVYKGARGSRTCTCR